MTIQEAIQKRILILDGAMGTQVQQFKLEEKDYRGEKFANHACNLKGNNDVLVLTMPHVIQKIHENYLQSGADIIETCSFNSTSVSQADYNLEKYVYEINFQAARIAKDAALKFSTADKPRFVAGSIGPTGKTCSMSPDVNDPGFRAVTFDQMAEAYLEQISGLAEGGADLLLIETVFDTLNCKAALFAAEEYFQTSGKRLPVMVSVTISDASGRTLSGQTLEAFYISISHADLFAVGMNCAMGAKQLRPYIEEISKLASVPTIIYPNAGLPNAFGAYDESAKEMAVYAEDLCSSGFINIIGGCCGTSPDHIKAIAEVAAKYPPRKIPKQEFVTKLSGLEPLKIDENSNFINVGERTNVAGSARFAKLIADEKYSEALAVARQQIENGANIIDISMDAPMIDAEKAIVKFLNLISSEPDISRVPVMIDSSRWEVIEAALKCLQGKGIVNSISLKEGEDKFLQRAQKIKQYGAALVVMCFDENGQAVTFERKIEICKRSYDLLTKKINFPPQDIVFDPNILTVATGLDEHNDYANDYFRATAWIKENLPYAKVSGGVSNVSFSFRGNDTVREAMHSAFLYHGIKAGMDMGIVNAGMIRIYDDIPAELLTAVEDVLLNRRNDATEQLVNIASKYSGKVTEKSQANLEWRNNKIAERIALSVLRGNDEFVEADMADAMKEFSTALSVIEGPLMDGMNRVGVLFGQGKMFLPQVVKSARVMKKAVGFLDPYMSSDDLNNASSKNGKVVLATVKGDVHDIGKNIVGVVLACNNFEVIDLGVMVHGDKILDEAEKAGASVIGLSGLITPSLDEMILIATEMERRKINIPLLIGGATTSLLHTAVKIAPVYSGPVIRVSDASQSAYVCQQLSNPNTRKVFVASVNAEYEKLRELSSQRNASHKNISLDEARKNSFVTDKNNYVPVKPAKPGIHVFNKISVEELTPYINWSYFFKAWDFKKSKYPEVLSDAVYGGEATRLLEDAKKMLQTFDSEK
ncbi:MAG: methionine synthase, partial [Bacteroidota bacterium]